MSRGIQLHVDDHSNAIVPYDRGTLAPNVPDDIWAYSHATEYDFYDAKTSYFDSNRRGVFHYALFVGRYKENLQSGGIGDVGGDDIVVAQRHIYEVARGMGKLRLLDLMVAGVFMHELGHNLGLRHWGDRDYAPCGASCQDGAGDPQYVSVMSSYYTRQVWNWPWWWGYSPNYGEKPGGWDDWKNLNLKAVKIP